MSECTNEKVTVLVSSHDKYMDAWEIFDYGIRKYWPDCPFKILMITNYAQPKLRSLKILPVGDDKGWGSNLLSALNKIKTPYVLYLQEDYWFKKHVDTNSIKDFIRIMGEYSVDYIRLNANPPPEHRCSLNSMLGTIAAEATYKTALQASIWRKEVLESLVSSHDNPWEFEKKGPVRSQKCSGDFLAIRLPEDNVFEYVGAIRKGKWTRSAENYLQQEDLKFPSSSIKSENFFDQLKNGNLVLLRLYRVFEYISKGEVVKLKRKIKERIWM